MLTRGKQIAYVPMSVIEKIGLESVHEDTIKGHAGVKYGFVMGPAPHDVSQGGIAYHICHYWNADKTIDKLPSYTAEHFILELSYEYVPQAQVDAAISEIWTEKRD